MDRKPAGLGGIVFALDIDVLGSDDGEERRGDGAPARVAVQLTEGAYLDKGFGLEASLLFQLALGGLLQGLMFFHETAGERPLVFIGIFPSAYQQHAKLAAVEAQDHIVDCHGGPPILIFEFFRLTHRGSILFSDTEMSENVVQYVICGDGAGEGAHVGEGRADVLHEQVGGDAVRESLKGIVYGLADGA